jgi:hypothetical protein
VRVVAAAIAAAAAQQAVTTAAVWHPAPGFMADFHRRCDGQRGTAFDACFAAAMAQSGASSAALAFTRRLDNQAYLQALQPTGGSIAIAHAVYPFRANENDAWLLVNGTPPLIDVDDQRYLPLAQMRASPAYMEIRHHYPNVTFWLGDRGRLGPEVLKNGREIIVGYLLRDLCHACAIIGRVRYAFNFDAEGKFLGARFVLIAPAGG